MTVKESILNHLPYAVRRSLVMARLSARTLGRRQKGARDFLLSSLSAANRMDRSLGRPVHVTIEPTNICNLRCPACETGDGSLGRRGKHMPMDQFRHVVDTMHEHLNVLYFYFMGEPFLVRNAYDMIEYAARKEIWVDTCTNGEFVDARNLIDSGIGRISFQIGGMTQATHERYRVRGDLGKSLDNLAACVEEKQKRPDSRTIVKVGFIVMKHNEHEVDEFVRTCEEIGVDDYEIVYPAVKSVEQGHEFLPLDDRFWIYDRTSFDRGILRPLQLSNHYCEWLYFTTTIQANGDVVPCCRDPRGQHVLGNVFEQDFAREIWNGDRYREFRHTVAHHQKDASICDLCSGYTAPDITRFDDPAIPMSVEPSEPVVDEPARVLA